jgi:hypothetical protein
MTGYNEDSAILFDRLERHGVSNVDYGDFRALFDQHSLTFFADVLRPEVLESLWTPLLKQPSKSMLLGGFLTIMMDQCSECFVEDIEFSKACFAACLEGLSPLSESQIDARRDPANDEYAWVVNNND